MRTKVEKYLEHIGFQRLMADIPGIDVYFTIENSFINALVLVDADGQPEVTDIQLDSFLEKSDWKAPGGETIDVHSLSVIFSRDEDKARSIGHNRMFCWYVNTERESLVIDEGKCADFYGMKAVLQKAVTEPEIQESSGQQEVTIEQPQNKAVSYVNYGLLIANFVMYVLCIFGGTFFYELGALNPILLVVRKQWYRFFTCMFLHADVYHLSGNMIYLYTLGDMAEKQLGHMKYLVLYLLSGLVGGFASMAFSVLTKDFTASVGASGAIFGITGALLWILIKSRGKNEVITVPKMIFLIAYSLYNGFISTNIDNAAHIGGLIGGFILAMLLYRKRVD